MASKRPDEQPVPGSRPASMWRRYVRLLGPKVAQDVDDELRFHFDMRVNDYIARGMSPAEARATTLARLGNVGTARTECVTIANRRERRMTRAQIVDAFVQDVQFGLRTLGRQKGWTAVAALTLALGIGANTAVFSVVNSLLLHPLPYPNSDRMAIVFQEPSQGNSTGMMVMMLPAPVVVTEWRSSSRAFETLEPYTTSSMTYRATGATPEVLSVARTLPSFVSFAGKRPLLGRGFTQADLAEGTHVAAISESMWRGRFASDTNILGKVVSLDDSLYTVVGVMPADLRLPRLSQNQTDLWLPLDLRNKNLGLAVIGRLRPGTSAAAAAADLDAISARQEKSASGKPTFRTRLVLPGEIVSWRQSLYLLSGAVALVLLIACANVAHLLLARAATRQRELAIRRALGAGRGRVLRQLLTESLLLAGAGCVGGLVLGWIGLRTLVAARPASLSELSDVHMNGTVLLATVGLSVVTGILFGLVGAVQASRQSTHEWLKAGSLTSSGTRRQSRMRTTLVVSEMALSATLLVGAMLLVRSVMHLQSIDPGFDVKRLYAVDIRLSDVKYPFGSAQRLALFRDLVARARTVPGVVDVTIANAAPPGRAFNIGALQLDGEPQPPKGTSAFIDFNGVQPEFFKFLGLRFVDGGTFTDTSEAAAQAIVNEGFAKKHWPKQRALGKRFRIVSQDGKGTWRNVVGVVANASTGGLTGDVAAPIIYFPAADLFAPSLLVRAASGVNPMAALKSMVNEVDRSLTPPEVKSVEQEMASSIELPRFTMLLLGIFAALAVLLAAVGLYGVLAYAVAQRTREIGIRMALGASQAHIARGVVRSGVVLAVAGMAIGLVGSFWATKLVRKMLYGVAPSDPASYVVAAVVLVLIAVLACVVPMRRATSVDALVAMRAE